MNFFMLGLNGIKVNFLDVKDNEDGMYFFLFIIL